MSKKELSQVNLLSVLRFSSQILKYLNKVWFMILRRNIKPRDEEVYFTLPSIRVWVFSLKLKILQNFCDMNSSQSTSTIFDDVDAQQIGFRGLLRYFYQQNPSLNKIIIQEGTDQQETDIHFEGIYILFFISKTTQYANYPKV